MLAYAYASYHSIKAIRRDRNTAVARWLKYFVVLALFELLHRGLSRVVGWLPLWWHLKLAALMYLHLPVFNGATWLFDTGVQYAFVQQHVAGAAANAAAATATDAQASDEARSVAEVDAGLVAAPAPATKAVSASAAPATAPVPTDDGDEPSRKPRKSRRSKSPSPRRNDMASKDDAQ